MADICGQHFQVDFLVWKLLYFDSNITVIFFFFTKGPIDDNQTLVRMMAWRGTRGKSLSAQMMA